MRLEFPPIFIRALDRQIVIHGADAPATGRAGGKPAADKLLKPVKANSKRARFLRFYFDVSFSHSGQEPIARGVTEAARHSNITRANVFTYWTTIQREHGIGYTLENDFIKPILPTGVAPVSIFK